MKSVEKKQVMYKKKQAIKDLLSTGFLLDTSKHEEYFRKNKIQVYNSEFGPKIFFGQREVSDGENISFEMRYGFGAFFDDIKHKGITHLIEHLWFSPEFNKLCSDNQVNKNGWTSSKAIELDMSGIWNLNYPNYSLGNILEELFTNFYKHSNITDEQRLLKEKEIILREIREFETDFIKYNLREIFWKDILPGHEICTNILGTTESLETIKLEDVQNHISNYFLPDQSYLKIYTEGESDKSTNITSQIDDHLSKILKDSKITKTDKFEISEYPTESSNFKTGKHEFSSGDKFKDKVIIMITTPLFIKSSEDFSFLLSIFEDKLSDDLFIETRKLGIAYSSNTWTLRINHEVILFGAYFISTTEAYEPLVSKFTDAFRSLIKKYTVDIEKWTKELNQEKIKILATPTTISEILNDTFEGEIEFGYPINSFFKREFINRISANQFIELAGLIFDQPYSIHILGDLH